MYEYCGAKEVMTKAIISGDRCLNIYRDGDSKCQALLSRGYGVYLMVYAENLGYSLHTTGGLGDRLDVMAGEEQVDGGLELSRGGDGGESGGGDRVALDLSHHQTREVPTMNVTEAVSEEPGAGLQGEHAEEINRLQLGLACLNSSGFSLLFLETGNRSLRTIFSDLDNGFDPAKTCLDRRDIPWTLPQFESYEKF